MTLDYVKIPVGLYQLKIRSLLELSILSLALSFGDTGLLLSNNDIGGIFNTDRTSVIRAIGRLVRKGYLRRVDNKLHRKLIVDSSILPLLHSGEAPPEIVALQALNSGASATHNISKVKKRAHRTKKPLCDNKSFERFWFAYSKKVEKAEAQKIWTKLNPSKELVEQIIAAVERQKQTRQWLKENGQYIPNPTTWLNRKRWQDEIPDNEFPTHDATNEQVEVLVREGVLPP